MTLFAQVQAPGAAEFGLFVSCVLGLLAIVWLSRQIWVSFHPPPAALPSHQDSYVTQAEFLTFKAEVRGDINRLETDIRAQLTQTRTEMAAGLTRLDADLKVQVRDLHTYTRDSFHRQASGAQNVLIEVTRLATLLEHGSEGRRHLPPVVGDEDEGDVRGQ